MTINQMQYFSTVCQYHNITTSARLLCISQPALSSSLSEMEAEVGFKLLDRTSKGVRPTAEGLRLLSHIEAVLARYRLLQKEIPAIAQSSNSIRVGFRPYGGETQMMQLCHAFKQKHSEVKIFYSEMTNRTPSLYLDEDQFDFLASAPRLLPEDWKKRYRYCKLGEPEEVRLYCHILNPLARLDAVGAAELDGCPIAFWNGHAEVLERLAEVMKKYGYFLNHVATLPQMSGIANLLCNNAAVGILRGDFVDHISILRACKIKEDLAPVFLSGAPVQNYLIWKRTSERFDIMKQFAEFARSWS